MLEGSTTGAILSALGRGGLMEVATGEGTIGITWGMAEGLTVVGALAVEVVIFVVFFMAISALMGGFILVDYFQTFYVYNFTN